MYLPTCVTRMMGPSLSDQERASVHEKLLSLFHKADYEVVYPEVGPAPASGLPCAQPRLRVQPVRLYVHACSSCSLMARQALVLPLPCCPHPSMLHSAAQQSSLPACAQGLTQPGPACRASTAPAAA